MGTDELLSHPVFGPSPVKDWGLYLIKIQIAIAIPIAIWIKLAPTSCSVPWLNAIAQGRLLTGKGKYAMF
jgi:hypothetical protein